LVTGRSWLAGTESSCACRGCLFLWRLVVAALNGFKARQRCALLEAQHGSGSYPVLGESQRPLSVDVSPVAFEARLSGLTLGCRTQIESSLLRATADKLESTAQVLQNTQQQQQQQHALHYTTRTTNSALQASPSRFLSLFDFLSHQLSLNPCAAERFPHADRDGDGAISVVVVLSFSSI
jgi:hypothetical protein